MRQSSVCVHVRQFTIIGVYSDYPTGENTLSQNGLKWEDFVVKPSSANVMRCVVLMDSIINI